VQTLLVSGELFRQNLDRDFTTELRITRAVDFTHAAFANGFEYLVMGELVTG